MKKNAVFPVTASKFIFFSDPGSQIMFFISVSLPVISGQIMLPEKCIIHSDGLVAPKQEQNLCVPLARNSDSTVK